MAVIQFDVLIWVIGINAIPKNFFIGTSEKRGTIRKEIAISAGTHQLDTGIGTEHHCAVCKTNIMIHYECPVDHNPSIGQLSVGWNGPGSNFLRSAGIG